MLHLLLSFAVIVAEFALVATAHAMGRPTVFVILADDQGWGDPSLDGNSNLRAPHIDWLARDDARFERCFVQPVCSPKGRSSSPGASTRAAA